MKKILKCLFVIGCLMAVGFSAVLFFSSVAIQYADYLEHKGSLVSVPATVSRVQEYEDSDDDVRYNIYLSYEYDDDFYENVFWESKSKSQYDEGDEINVKISSDDPEYIKPTDIGGGSLIFVLLVISSIVAACIHDTWFYKNKNVNDIRFIDEKVIMRELSPKLNFALANVAFGYGVGFVGSVFFLPDLINNMAFAFWGCLIGLVLLFIGIIRTLNLSDSEYSINVHKCLNCWSENDGDTTSNYVSFENIHEKSHGKKIFEHAVPGVPYYVLRNKRGSIMEIYDVHTWKLDVDFAGFKEGRRKSVLKGIIGFLSAGAIMFLVPVVFRIISQIIAA